MNYEEFLAIDYENTKIFVSGIDVSNDILLKEIVHVNSKVAYISFYATEIGGLILRNECSVRVEFTNTKIIFQCYDLFGYSHDDLPKSGYTTFKGSIRKEIIERKYV